MSVKTRKEIELEKLDRLIKELEEAVRGKDHEPNYVRITEEEDGIRFEGHGSASDIMLLLTKSLCSFIEETIDVEYREDMLDETFDFMKEYITIKRVKVEKQGRVS